MNMYVLNKMLTFNANLELENMRFFKKKRYFIHGIEYKNKNMLTIIK